MTASATAVQAAAPEGEAQGFAPGLEADANDRRDFADSSESGDGRRRRRRRGRGGRDGEDLSVSETGALDSTESPTASSQGDTPEADMTATAPASLAPVASVAEAGDGHAMMQAPHASEETIAAPAPVAPPTPYVLPLPALQSLAAEAGLIWIQSDSEKVRIAQEAIAQQPKPVHIPREPKPPVVVDEGPLVLVETRKDLSQVRMPFDEPAGR